MAVSAYVIAAICGNFDAESTINPAIWEDTTPMSWDYEYDDDNPNLGGYGLGQWTNVGSPHDRLWNLYQYVSGQGEDMTDGNAQLDFLIYEGRWNSSASDMGFNSLSEFLASTSTDVRGLAADYMHCWEGIFTSSVYARMDAAEDYLDYIVAHANDDPDDYTWIWRQTNTSRDYLEMPERYNNTMCVYFKLNGYTPGPGPGPGPGPEPPHPMNNPFLIAQTLAARKRRGKKQTYRPYNKQ